MRKDLCAVENIYSHLPITAALGFLFSLFLYLSSCSFSSTLSNIFAIYYCIHLSFLLQHRLWTFFFSTYTTYTQKLFFSCSSYAYCPQLLRGSQSDENFFRILLRCFKLIRRSNKGAAGEKKSTIFNKRNKKERRRRKVIKRRF